MAATDHLSGVQFKHTADPNFVDRHWMEASRGERNVGYMEWGGPQDKAENTIQDIFVEPHMRRMGVATEMLNRAREVSPGLEHSSDLTDDGEAWAGARP